MTTPAILGNPKYNPLLTPDWRWRRAEHLASVARKPGGWDDIWVRRALRHVKDKGTVKGTRLRPAHHEAIEAAIALCDEAQRTKRWVVESSLLTSMPMTEIAHRCCLPEPAIEAFHAFFFDVRPRLRAKDWLMGQLLKTTWLHGFTGLDLGALWKYAAITSGPIALEFLIAVTADSLEVHRFVSPEIRRLAKPYQFLGRLFASARLTDADQDWAALLEAQSRMNVLKVKAGSTDATDAKQCTVYRDFFRVIAKTNQGQYQREKERAGSPKPPAQKQPTAPMPSQS